jgi:2-dehydro-3-deoxygalactonokinase
MQHFIGQIFWQDACLFDTILQTNVLNTPFISCDWGTSNFRLRLRGTGAEDEAGVRSDEGVAKLAASSAPGQERAALFQATLKRGLTRLGAASGLPVLISGMASASIGWKELPYARLPFPLDGSAAVWEQLQPGVYLISGLRSDEDVMRGEETQALGVAAGLRENLPAHALFVLPGTHSKHMEIESGCVVAFRTYMVGELFELLTRHSVLRHSTDPSAATDDAAFVDGVMESQRTPMLAGLFRVRTRQVLEGHGAAANTSFLSGLLIGTELAMLRHTETPVIVAADAPMQRWYAMAARAMGREDRFMTVDSEPLSALGQAVLWQRFIAQEKQ